MPRYRDIFREIMNNNEALFADFAEVHQKYQADGKKWQKEFNELGAQMMELLRDGERTLCGKTERGQNAVFSARLADKYWTEVKAFFPLIDFVGVTVR